VWLLATLAAALWPVWRWMAHRFADGSGDRWEWLAAATAVAVLVRDRSLMPRHGGAVNLWMPVALLIAYAVSYAQLSPLPRALLAMAALGTASSASWYGKRVDVALCGLLLISLPVMASLNFYVGYPLRVVTGSIAEALLQLNGIAAVREGAQLQWNGQIVAIDAPCSGVKMLWTGAYLSLSLAAMMRLSDLRTLALLGCSALVVMLANAFRATSLFYVEAGLIQAPDQLHDAVGVVMFAFAAATVFALARTLAGSHRAL
jgi:exosortase